MPLTRSNMELPLGMFLGSYCVSLVAVLRDVGACDFMAHTYTSMCGAKAYYTCELAILQGALQCG